MDFGNLKDHLKKNILPNTPVNWKNTIKMAMDVAQGMNYLHSLVPIVIHRFVNHHNVLSYSNACKQVTYLLFTCRDLKTSNILVDKSLNLKVNVINAYTNMLCMHMIVIYVYAVNNYLQT